MIRPYDDLRDGCAELAVLWPALLAALPRDTASPGTNPGHPHPGQSTLLVNGDVLAVADRLRQEIPAVVGRARRLLRAAPTAGGIPAMILAVPGYLTRLDALRRPQDAETLAAHIQAWLGVVRRALRLTDGGRPLPAVCPRHDQPAVRLRVEADRGRLHQSIVEGWYARAVVHAEGARRPLPEAVAWQKGEEVVCDGCGTRWAGITRLAILARQLDEAAARRAQGMSA